VKEKHLLIEMLSPMPSWKA